MLLAQVVNAHHQPLMDISMSQAARLLKSGIAEVYCVHPYTIQMKPQAYEFNSLIIQPGNRDDCSDKIMDDVVEKELVNVE